MLRPTFLLVSCGVSAALSAQAGRLDRFPPPGGAFGEPAITDARLADQLRLQAVPLRWRDLLRGDERVLYLGDMPAHRETKRYLAAVLGDFRAAGFTHLALEAGEGLQPALDRFCGGRDEGRTGEALARTAGPEAAAGSLELLRSACTAGLSLVALEPREHDDGAMARRLADLLDRDPSARALALLRRHRAATEAQPSALRKLGFASRGYSFLTGGAEEPVDRGYYLALDAAGLRESPLLLPCPPEIGAHGCLALPSVLQERARR